MWKKVLPEVPKHLFRGRGLGHRCARVYFNDGRNREIAVDPLASVILVGNFHNGPLSILIPFGLYGVIAFVWFLVAGLRVLHRNWKFGDPALQTVNALLLAAFAARAIFFFVVFGALQRTWRSSRGCWA